MNDMEGTTPRGAEVSGAVDIYLQVARAVRKPGPERVDAPKLVPEVASNKPTNPKDMVGVTKLMLNLCSPIAKAYWAMAQFAGMLKYGAWNWRAAGVRTSIYLAAMQRHLDAYMSGEEHDPVDGTHHLGNIMACAAILLDAKAAGKLTDDRPPVVGLRDVYSECETLMAKLKEQYADRAPKHFTIHDNVSQ